MTTRIDTSADYFCYDHYLPAGRPMMESALREYARLLLLHRSIAGADIDDLTAVIMARQAELAEQHHSWKPVEIRYSAGTNGLVWFYIGESHLQLQKIEGRFEGFVQHFDPSL